MAKNPLLIDRLIDYRKNNFPHNMTLSELNFAIDTLEHLKDGTGTLSAFDVQANIGDDFNFTINENSDMNGDKARWLAIFNGTGTSDQVLAGTYSDIGLSEFNGKFIKQLHKNIQKFKQKNEYTDSNLAKGMNDILFDQLGTDKQFIDALNSAVQVDDKDVVSELHNQYYKNVVAAKGITSGADMVTLKADLREPMVDRLQFLSQDLMSLTDITPIILDNWRDGFETSIENKNGDSYYTDTETSGDIKKSDFFPKLAASLLYSDTNSHIINIIKNVAC